MSEGNEAMGRDGNQVSNNRVIHPGVYQGGTNPWRGIEPKSDPTCSGGRGYIREARIPGEGLKPNIAASWTCSGDISERHESLERD